MRDSYHPARLLRSGRNERGEKGGKPCPRLLCSEEEVESVLDLLDVERLLACLVSEDQLLQIQERAPMRDLLTQLDSRLPRVLALSPLADAALHPGPHALGLEPPPHR